MEGLIPFIYKAIIKERRRRSYSTCSSGGSASGARAVHDHDDVDAWGEPARKEAVDDGKFHAERETAHRRHRSLEELAGEVGATSTWRSGALPRGRSARIFSCISGM